MISVQAKWETNKTLVAFKSWRRVFVTVIQVSIIKWYIPQNSRTDGGKTMFKQGHHQQARYDHSTLWECRDLQTHSWDQRQIIDFEPRGSWENNSNTLCLSQIRFPDEKHISIIYYIIKYMSQNQASGHFRASSAINFGRFLKVLHLSTPMGRTKTAQIVWSWCYLTPNPGLIISPCQHMLFFWIYTNLCWYLKYPKIYSR